MDILNRHPSDDDLDEYVIGTLPYTEFEAIHTHLLICYRWRERLDETAEFVAALRRAVRDP
jgi:anti-sigma factor ChrR (cupin superfamily)